MIADPRFAPKRKDLPWLRRRRLPKAAAAPAPPQSAAPPLKDFVTGHSTGPHHPADHSPPLSPPTAPATSSLDLDEPTPTPVPAAAPSSSSLLDLDDPPLPPPAPVSTSRRSDGPERRVRTDVRVRLEERLILTPADPTVTLTPLQSGIGTLTIEAAVSDAVGDLRLGCAYELASDLQMTMQMTQGSRLAPPHSKRPILVGGRDRFERITVDLRQCRELRRLVVYAFSEARRPLAWGGTLVVTTFGGGRVEVPLESLQGGTVAVLMSIYQVRGEFVVRAEMQALYGDVREASRAYGYEKITWLDDRTPVS